jgi:hypothetical protein
MGNRRSIAARTNLVPAGIRLLTLEASEANTNARLRTVRMNAQAEIPYIAHFTSVVHPAVARWL